MRLGLLVGLAAVILLVAWQGIGVIVDRLAVAGWGLVLVALFVPPDLWLRTASFRLLFAPGRRPGFIDAMWAMWIGSSVNFMLPVATIGGEFVKARILTLRAVRGVDAAASVVLDKTVQALSLVLWALSGIAILIMVAPDEPMVTPALIGSALLTLGIAGFVVAQYAGAFGTVARPAGRLTRGGKWQTLVDSAAELDVAIRGLYRRPGTIAASTLLRLAKRALMAGEVWLVAWLLGYPIGPAEAVMLNSLAIAVRGAAFVIPGGFGVQEGGYIVLGAVVGVPPDVMLAISLATRIGELIEGVPGLVSWQVAESGAYWRRWKPSGPPPR